jgi:RHS repeat-associated protein
LCNAVQKNTSTQATVTSNAYNYDPAGNRLVEKTLSTTKAGQFNNLNQLMGFTSSSTSLTVAGHTSAAVTSVNIDATPATISNSTNFTASVSMPSGTNVVSVVAQPSSTNSLITTQRYQLVASGSSPTALTYDLNGNVLTDENGNSYTWDALNRLTKITYPSGASSLFAYDGLSRRVQIVEKNASGGTTSTLNNLWIGQAMAEQRASNGTTVTRRFFPQGEQQSGTNYYYTRDHLGSVRELISATGTLNVRYGYDPYGRESYLSGSGSTPIQYAGMYYHSASGLNLTKYRAYDPNTGRWLSRDPLKNAEMKLGPNLYEYVGNDPVFWIDPLGLLAWQLGLSFNVQVGPVNFNASVGITGDWNGNFGWYSTQGSGPGSGFGGGLGLTVTGSVSPNANCIQDLAGPFAQGGANGGDAIDGFVEGYSGQGVQGQPVSGGSVTIGAGGGANVWGGVTNTQVHPF